MYFAGLAQTYAQHRPSYPVAAIDFILEGMPVPVRAADIGCGTGISSRLLAENGAAVIGIDPNQEMLDEARSAGSDHQIEYKVGQAERLPLDDASVDLVLCAQSFHWFDPHATLREFHRVTKAGKYSRAALMWNLRDESDPFTAGYGGVVRAAQEDAATRGLIVNSERAGDITLGGYFINPRTRSFPNPQSLDEDALLGRIRSASYFPKTGPLRDEREDTLRTLFKEHQRDGHVTLMHRTEVTLADRAG